MFAEPFDDADGYRIWLDLDETDELLAAADSREERIAFALGVRSGLRVREIVSVEAKDVAPNSSLFARGVMYDRCSGDNPKSISPDSIVSYQSKVLRSAVAVPNPSGARVRGYLDWVPLGTPPKAPLARWRNATRTDRALSEH